MEHLIFYYGAWIMGFVSLISMLAVYRRNKKVLKDLRHPAEAKDRWTAGFIQEHQKLLRENTEIHNPSVYVMKRMRGRKIGPWSMRQVKGISWGTFILSFLLIGMELFTLWQGKVKTLDIPFVAKSVPAMQLVIISGISMGIVLLSLRLLLGSGYQEELIETNLLDYVENRWKEPPKIIPMENVKAAVQKEAKVVRKKEVTKNTENKEKEKAAKQMEQGIMEAAAADDRYSHLLNKEEEAIVKDVIKEFLT